MTKDELIVKQQLEIEELKNTKARYKAAVYGALAALNHPEQWSIKSPDFPKVAMRGILSARDVLEAV